MVGLTRYLAQRIVRMAWEDIDLADPRAYRLPMMRRLPTSSWVRRRELALGQVVIYLAVAAKSNAGLQRPTTRRRLLSASGVAASAGAFA